MTTTFITTSSGVNGVTVMSGSGTQQGQQLLQQPYYGAHMVPSVQVAPVNRSSSRAESYLSRQSMGLGITLIVTGALAVIFNGVGFPVGDSLAAVSHGFYCGAVFIITGSFGVAAATNKNKCLIVTFMVLAIISAVLTLNLLIVGIVGAVVNQCNYDDFGYGSSGCSSYYYSGSCSYVYYRPPCKTAAVAMEALEACLAVVAAITSIWGSAICCKAVCCCGYTTYEGAILSAPYGNQPVVIFGQQQMMGNSMVGRSQVVPVTGAPLPYQPTAQYWTAPPYQLHSQAAANSMYENSAVSTSAEPNVMPPAYSAVSATAPTDQPYKY